MFGTNEEDSEDSRGNSFHISCLQRNETTTTELEQEGGSRREEIGVHGTGGGPDDGGCEGKAWRPARGGEAER